MFRFFSIPTKGSYMGCKVVDKVLWSIGFRQKHVSFFDAEHGSEFRPMDANSLKEYAARLNEQARKINLASREMAQKLLEQQESDEDMKMETEMETEQVNLEEQTAILHTPIESTDVRISAGSGVAEQAFLEPESTDVEMYAESEEAEIEFIENKSTELEVSAGSDEAEIEFLESKSTELEVSAGSDEAEIEFLENKSTDIGISDGPDEAYLEFLESKSTDDRVSAGSGKAKYKYSKPKTTDDRISAGSGEAELEFFDYKSTDDRISAWSGVAEQEHSEPTLIDDEISPGSGETELELLEHESTDDRISGGSGETELELLEHESTDDRISAESGETELEFLEHKSTDVGISAGSDETGLEFLNYKSTDDRLSGGSGVVEEEHLEPSASEPSVPPMNLDFSPTSLLQLRLYDSINLICVVNSQKAFEMREVITAIFHKYEVETATVMQYFRGHAKIFCLETKQQASSEDDEQNQADNADASKKDLMRSIGVTRILNQNPETGDMTLSCPPLELSNVLSKLHQNGYVIQNTEYVLMPRQVVQLDVQQLQNYTDFLRQILDIDGVLGVYDNVINLESHGKGEQSEKDA